MAPPDRTVLLPRPDTATRLRRARRAIRRWCTGPRRLTTLAVIMLAAGVAVSSLTVFGKPSPSMPAPVLAGQQHTAPPPPAPTKPVPAKPAAPVKQAPHVPTVAAPHPAAGGTIRIRRGDTLWALARRYGTTVAALRQLNGLGDSTRIYAGQSLHVPGTPRPTTAPATPVSNPVSAPVPNPVVPAAVNPEPSGFQGIYAFSGNNTADLAGDPDVAGRSLVYYWGQLEPEPGVYRWDLIDKDMAPWVAAGKKVILRVATAGWASWDKPADSAHGTPAWVYAQGVKSVTEKDGAVLPQYWNPAFETDLNRFLHAFAARYDGNPHVALVDLAVGIGGETKPDSEKNPGLLSLWQGIGYTDPIWWSYVQQVITDYTSAFTHTPLAVMPDKTFLGNTPGYTEATTLNYAVSKGIWLQDNGLLPGRTLPAPWGRTPVVSEQRNPTTKDGNSLAAELQAAVHDKARIILIFTDDLTNPADQAIIHQFVTGHGGSTGTGTPPVCKPGPIPATAEGAQAVMCPLTGTAPAPAQPRPTHRQHGTTKPSHHNRGDK